MELSRAQFQKAFLLYKIELERSEQPASFFLVDLYLICMLFQPQAGDNTRATITQANASVAKVTANKVCLVMSSDTLQVSSSTDFHSTIKLCSS